MISDLQASPASSQIFASFQILLACPLVESSGLDSPPCSALTPSIPATASDFTYRNKSYRLWVRQLEALMPFMKSEAVLSG